MLLIYSEKNMKSLLLVIQTHFWLVSRFQRTPNILIEWRMSSYLKLITLLSVFSNPSPVFINFFNPPFLSSLNWTTSEHALPFDFLLVIDSFSFMSSERRNKNRRRQRKCVLKLLRREKNFSLIKTTLFRWVLFEW